ncbi:MAG: ComEC/Rec2 family competence protein, partial [Clostridia bacterium]|nr:ComEC/Rec2 family competence protein [Clostridia bacterium]
MLSACLFLIGCIMGRILNLNVYLLSGGCICLIAAGLFPARRNRRWIALIIAITMLPLGALRFTLAWRAADPLPEQKNAAITGDIVDLFDYDIEKTRRVCAVNHLMIDGVPVSGTLRLYIRGEFDDLKEMHIAQRVECTGNIYTPDGASNPFEFDFADYLRVQGLNGYASVKVENAALFDREVQLEDVPAVLRGRIAARIDRLFPENGGIIKAFLIGDRSDLADDLRAAYNRSGVAHLLAISGMHISILAGFCMLLLRRFLKRGWAFGITMALLMAYGFLIGFSASLLRAFIMFGLYNAAPLLGRQSD